MKPAPTVLLVGGLHRRQVSAIKQKANRLGVSPEMYVKQLIEEDLELDRTVRQTSLRELAEPFRVALKGVSEDEIDRRVEAARSQYRRRISKRK